MIQRLLKMIKTIALICSIGLGYVLLLRYTGIRIPCVFYEVTGWYCAGCGVTRMCLSLLRMDLENAFRANAALFLMLPLLGLLLVSWTIRYLRTGEGIVRKWQNIVIYIMIILLCLFGVLRNLPEFSFLAPLG